MVPPATLDDRLRRGRRGQRQPRAGGSRRARDAWPRSSENLQIYAFGAALGGQRVLDAATILADQSDIPHANLILIDRHQTYAHNDPNSAFPEERLHRRVRALPGEDQARPLIGDSAGGPIRAWATGVSCATPGTMNVDLQLIFQNYGGALPDDVHVAHERRDRGAGRTARLRQGVRRRAPLLRLRRVSGQRAVPLLAGGTDGAHRPRHRRLHPALERPAARRREDRPPRSPLERACRARARPRPRPRASTLASAPTWPNRAIASTRPRA